MDQFWIYLLVAIIYLVGRALKKAANPPGDVGAPDPSRPVHYDPKPSTERPKPLTFEELLKEITEAKQPKPPVYENEPQPTYVDYDDQIGEEAQDLEEVEVERDYRKKDNIYDIYEQAKQQAFERPSLEETMNVRNTNVEFGKFKEFQTREEPKLIEKYAVSFQDPEGLKKAVVLSEILNRRFEY